VRGKPRQRRASYTKPRQPFPGARLRQDPSTHPFAPTKLPSRPSTAQPSALRIVRPVCDIGLSGGGFVPQDYTEASACFRLPPSVLLCLGQGYPSGNNPQTPSEPAAVRRWVFRYLRRTLLAPRTYPGIELGVASAGDHSVDYRGAP
jgi:hypothetical protein